MSAILDTTLETQDVKKKLNESMCSVQSAGLSRFENLTPVQKEVFFQRFDDAEQISDFIVEVAKSMSR